MRNGDTLALRPAADAHHPVKSNAGPSNFDLVVVGGPAAGRMVSLGPGEYVIGRDASCDVAVEDPSMSRRHLRLKIDGARVTVVDPGLEQRHAGSATRRCATTSPTRSPTAR